MAWPRQRPELGDGSGGCGAAELGKGRWRPEWLGGGGEQLQDSIYRPGKGGVVARRSEP